MAEIVIEKWYGKEKTDLLSKNTIDKVEFFEGSTDIVGGEVLNKAFWLYGETDDQAFSNAGFSSMTKRQITGSTTKTTWADKLRTEPTETLGNATITFPNKFGDTIPANYAVTVRCSFKQTSDSSFLIYDFLKGSLVTPDTENSATISGEVSFSFSGDNIILSLSNMLLCGDYFVVYNDFPEFNEKRSYVPWQWTVKVVYGGLQTETEKKDYGTGENSIKFDKNSLIEKHTTIEGVPVSQKIAETILSEFANGKQTISLTVLCGKFKDENGNIVIDIDSEDENVKHLIEIGDTFTLRKRGSNLYPRGDGTQRKFLVTKANLSYHGKPKMLIEGVEV